MQKSQINSEHHKKSSLTTKSGHGALDGILVVDFTRVLGPPFCTMLLGDLGAEVLKIELPGVGDEFRHSPPVIENESFTFILHNRNKKSITINLKTQKGKEILYALIKKADVFVENLKPDSTRDLKIDYATLSKMNPRLVYCSISGFGQEGPLKNYPAYDLIAQAMSGMLSISGTLDGRMAISGISLCDLAAGIYGALGIVSSLYSRESTGVGQHVDVSLLRSTISVLGPMAGIYSGENRIPRPGEKERFIIPYGIFETMDRPIVIEAAGPVTWKKLCEAIGALDWLTDERFATNLSRRKYRDDLIPALQEKLKKKTSSEWLELFSKLGVPAAPILNLQEVFEHPHMQETGMITTLNHPKLGKVRTMGPAIKLSKTPLTIRSPPPSLGQHTDEILTSLGFSKDEITSFHSEGVV